MTYEILLNEESDNMFCLGKLQIDFNLSPGYIFMFIINDENCSVYVNKEITYVKFSNNIPESYKSKIKEYIQKSLN